MVHGAEPRQHKSWLWDLSPTTWEKVTATEAVAAVAAVL